MRLTKEQATLATDTTYTELVEPLTHAIGRMDAIVSALQERNVNTMYLWDSAVEVRVLASILKSKVTDLLTSSETVRF